MAPRAAWEVYQEHLEVFKYGLPLWDPSPVTVGAPSYPLEIITGSVIYPGEMGRFKILLNAMKEGDDSYWQPNGVPTGFQTLQAFVARTGSKVSLSGPTLLTELNGVLAHNITIERSSSAGVDLTL